MARFTGVLGILAILLFALVFSSNRKAIRIKTIVVGLSLQFLFAILVLRVGIGQRAMAAAGATVTTLLGYSFAGSQFLFGDLAANFPERVHLCFPSSSHHHLHRGLLFDSVLLRRHAVHHSSNCESDDATHGRQRRRVDGRCRRISWGTPKPP